VKKLKPKLYKGPINVKIFKPFYAPVFYRHDKVPRGNKMQPRGSVGRYLCSGGAHKGHRILTKTGIFYRRNVYFVEDYTKFDQFYKDNMQKETTDSKETKTTEIKIPVKTQGKMKDEKTLRSQEMTLERNGDEFILQVKNDDEVGFFSDWRSLLILPTCMLVLS